MPDFARRWFPRLLIIVLVMVYARGIFPFVAVEGDEQGVINGILAAEQHRVNFLDFAYIYPIQPGSFWLIRLAHAICGGRLISVFGSLTALGAAGFIAVMAFLGARLCGGRPAWIALALLCCQELVSAGWYANTCAMAAPLTAGALLLGFCSGNRTTLLGAAALIALGAWVRMDSLLITPVFLPLAFAQCGDLRRAMLRTAVVALASAAGLLVLLAVSGTSLTEAWSTYVSQPYGEGWISLWHKFWLVGSILITAATVLGVIYLLICKDALLIVCGLCAGLPAVLVYGHTFTTTKYLYYAVPFAVFVCVGTAIKILQRDSRRGRLAIGAAVLALVAEGFIGVRTTSDEFRRFFPARGIKISQLSLPLRTRPVQLILGEGEILGTDDAFRLRAGWFFAASAWHREKIRALTETTRLNAGLTDRASLIISSTYLASRLVTGELLAQGAIREDHIPIGDDESSFKSRWRTGSREIVQVLVNNSVSETKLFARYAAEGNPSSTLFINDRGQRAARYLGVNASGWTCLSPSEDGLLAIYEKK